MSDLTSNGFSLSIEKRHHFSKEENIYISTYTYDDFPEIFYHDHLGDFEISLITHGFGYHYINGSIKEVSKGNVVFVDPGSWHSLFPVDRENSTRLQVINCVFRRIGFKELELCLPELHTAFDYFSNPDENHPLRLCSNCLSRDLAAYCKFLIYHIEDLNREDRTINAQSILLSIAAMLLEIYRKLPNNVVGNAKKPLNPLLQQAVDLIRDNLSNPDFMICDIYEKIFISKSHLCTLFREYLNTSPIRYLNTLRIQYACDLIRKGYHINIDLYAACGYNEYNTFYINFKQITGFSIRSYIKALSICRQTIKNNTEI